MCCNLLCAAMTMLDTSDPAAVKQFMRTLGAKGGKARLKTMSKKDRSESAKKAANARWSYT